MSTMKPEIMTSGTEVCYCICLRADSAISVASLGAIDLHTS